MGLRAAERCLRDFCAENVRATGKVSPSAVKSAMSAASLDLLIPMKAKNCIARCRFDYTNERAVDKAISALPGLVFANIFFPDGWMFADEGAEKLDAFGGVQVDDLDAVLA